MMNRHAKMALWRQSISIPPTVMSLSGTIYFCVLLIILDYILFQKESTKSTYMTMSLNIGSRLTNQLVLGHTPQSIFG